MMDANYQITQQLDDPNVSTACMDAKRLCHSAMLAYPVWKVLDDDDLLIEILVRLGFPTSLVRAALVCKRWFHHASDPTFLRRFRTLHPPRLLGLYIQTSSHLRPRLVLVFRHPPELMSVLRRTSYDIKGSVMGSRNGVAFGIRYDHATRSIAYASHYLFYPERDMVSIPPLPRHTVLDGNIVVFHKLLPKEECVRASYWYVVMESTKDKTKSILHVYTLQDGLWCMYASAVTELPCQEAMLVGNKLYMPASPSDILVFDLTALSFSSLQLPQGLVIGGKTKGTMMSCADDDTGVYFIKLDKVQLCVWLHKGDNCELVDTICLYEMCANLMVSDDTLKEKDLTTLRLILVGDDAKFVILSMGTYILYLDIKRRRLRKVYVMEENERLLGNMHPLMMIWPPSFPALKEDLVRVAV